jgi:hypothetical protein
MFSEKAMSHNKSMISLAPVGRIGELKVFA